MRVNACLVALALAPWLALRAHALGDTRLAWGRSDTNLHMGGAFAGSLAGTEFFKWQGMSKPRATLLSSMLITAGGLLKEFAIDRAASGSDLMANGIGVGANALFQFTIRF